jgi:hypothetical protein
MLDNSCRTSLCATSDFVANGVVTALLSQSVTISRAASRIRSRAISSASLIPAGSSASILAAQAGVFSLAYLVERLAEMAHDVEPVEQDRGLRVLHP